MLHDPELVKVTAFPLAPPGATTVKLLLKVALAGGTPTTLASGGNGASGIVVNADLCTSRPEVFAAGDVVEGAYERIATAIGQGSLAARSVLKYLGSLR